MSGVGLQANGVHKERKNEWNNNKEGKDKQCAPDGVQSRNNTQKPARSIEDKRLSLKTADKRPLQVTEDKKQPEIADKKLLPVEESKDDPIQQTKNHL